MFASPISILTVLAAALLHQSPVPSTAIGQNTFTPPAVVANDNRKPAGSMADGALQLKLRAADGMWRPEGDAGPALRIEAFGEAGQSLSAPAPLIRVNEGTPIVITIANDLESSLRVGGLCDRAQTGCAPVEVAPGATQ